MPIIPNVPGVPPLNSYGGASIVLLTSDVLRTLLGQLVTRWGIYRDGLPVLVADNVISLDLTQDYSISDYPVEAGAFQSYNKVATPTRIRMRFSAGGSDANRQIFLQSIDAVMSGTDLYDIVTPEKVYTGFAFSHRDFQRRADQGVGLIVVDIHMTEVRQTATATYTSTQQPAQGSRQGLGNIQPQSVSGTAGIAGFNAAEVT